MTMEVIKQFDLHIYEAYAYIEMLGIEILCQIISYLFNSKEVSVEAGTIYYWSIITSDGSISVNSDVFSFRVD